MTNSVCLVKALPLFAVVNLHYRHAPPSVTGKPSAGRRVGR
jgi:hypothetical protein